MFPCCRQSYQQATAYKKHLETIHLDIVLSHIVIATTASIRPPTFIRDQLDNLTDPDYESDSRLEIPDFHTTSTEIDNMQNDSAKVGVSYPQVCVHPSGQETLPVQGDYLAKLMATQSSTRP